jgi:carbon storage regulator
MLVLSRKLDESIVIGNNIRITVVGIRGGQVRIGIEAPPSVKVFREELCMPDRVKSGATLLELNDDASKSVGYLSARNGFVSH